MHPNEHSTSSSLFKAPHPPHPHSPPDSAPSTHSPPLTIVARVRTGATPQNNGRDLGRLSLGLLGYLDKWE